MFFTNTVLMGLVMVVVRTVSADGCPYTELSFAKKEGNCMDYEMGDVAHTTDMTMDPYKINYFADNYLPFCTTRVCGDGRHHLFCTVNGRSVGECIGGDPVANFKNIYGARVTSVEIKYGTLSGIPALFRELYDGFTSDVREITLYEHAKHKGDYIEITTKVGVCNNLPENWQMRVSSYGSKKPARFYTGENCTGWSASACRDLGSNNFWDKTNNLWGLLCTVDGLNDNTRSFRF